MENNFYVGIVCHKRPFTNNMLREKTVLYTKENITYIDLVKEREYQTDKSLKDYVEESSLIPTDINDYRIDYSYLLSKYNGKVRVRRR